MHHTIRLNGTVRAPSRSAHAAAAARRAESKDEQNHQARGGALGMIVLLVHLPFDSHLLRRVNHGSLPVEVHGGDLHHLRSLRALLLRTLLHHGLVVHLECNSLRTTHLHQLVCHFVALHLLHAHDAPRSALGGNEGHVGADHWRLATSEVCAKVHGHGEGTRSRPFHRPGHHHGSEEAVVAEDAVERGKEGVEQAPDGRRGLAPGACRGAVLAPALRLESRLCGYALVHHRA
mmetsp:Transcript_6376/g.16603  ORF Transcript_6376/g.16603 Transcript_6376/m.16603 type:complete len:233 (+) Transcript_6376:404-1102(+)